MIQKFVDAFLAQKDVITQELAVKHPDGYDGLVKRVVEVCANAPHEYHNAPDPERIHIIDDGDYQGTKLYVIGAQGYQPSRYWSIFVDYGSCSGCDSFEATRRYRNDKPDEEQVSDYWGMMLHMVQGMRCMSGGDE